MRSFTVVLCLLALAMVVGCAKTVQIWSVENPDIIDQIDAYFDRHPDASLPVGDMFNRDGMRRGIVLRKTVVTHHLVSTSFDMLLVIYTNDRILREQCISNLCCYDGEEIEQTVRPGTQLLFRDNGDNRISVDEIFVVNSETNCITDGMIRTLFSNLP